MHWILWLIVVGASLNFLLLISMIFLEKRKPENIIAWMTTLTFLPVVGFIFYIIFGSGLSVRVRRMIKRKAISERDIIRNIDGIETLEETKIKDIYKKDIGIVSLAYSFGAYPLPGNDIKIFNDGPSLFQSLKQDVISAKKCINIEYYIFADDKTGKQMMALLCQKAREGVEVNLIYDSVGSRKAPRRFFRKLEKAGGKVGEFFPPFMNIRLINLKMNYRNHRKIVVIDGKIGYTGGINIRDDHMGKHKRLNPWRDTHVRIEGAGVYGLQNIFLDDWRYCTNDNTPPKIYLENGYFPSPSIMGDASVQIISSGPDSPVQKIKETYVKLITNAKYKVYIQTPYFIPDDVFFSALRIAVRSGVDIRIMVPKIPDKHTVYLATLSYLKQMAEMGVKVYLYNGFLHSKTLIVDNNKLSIGTCNMDNRSFGLNFEDTVLIYSKKINDEYVKTFEKDMVSSQEVNVNYFQKKRWITKFLQAIMRLLSSLF
ncbi:MAG: cardiolipin synthase [Clostridia bacterium]|nr:cardiolipin synthase [Clostridia bacterium]MBQ8792368.1 cardiolipin synthase [Clostridia bacterium]